MWCEEEPSKVLDPKAYKDSYNSSDSPSEGAGDASQRKFI